MFNRTCAVSLKEMYLYPVDLSCLLLLRIETVDIIAKIAETKLQQSIVLFENNLWNISTMTTTSRKTSEPFPLLPASAEFKTHVFFSRSSPAERRMMSRKREKFNADNRQLVHSLSSSRLPKSSGHLKLLSRPSTECAFLRAETSFLDVFTPRRCFLVTDYLVRTFHTSTVIIYHFFCTKILFEPWHCWVAIVRPSKQQQMMLQFATKTLVVRDMCNQKLFGGCIDTCTTMKLHDEPRLTSASTQR